MSENADFPGLDGLVSTLTGETPNPVSAVSGLFGSGGGRPPLGASTAAESGFGSGSLFGTLENLIFGSRRRSGDINQAQRRPPPPGSIRRRPPRRQTQRRPPPIQRPFRRRQDSQNIIYDDFRPSAPIRTKRQTRLQGNIIR